MESGPRYQSRVLLFVACLLMFVQVPFLPATAFAKMPNMELAADQVRLIPGGQTVGVKLKTVGVLIVGHHAVEQEGNRRISPAELAKLQMGDIVLAINGQKVNSAKHFSELVQRLAAAGERLQLDVERDGQTRQTEIQPILDKQTNKYRLGIYVRDTAAGIGTMTFYSNLYKVYGALGHMITDIDSHAPLKVANGEILPSEVTSVRKGAKGEPGEKRAQIIHGEAPYGNIEKNTDFGIFGELTEAPEQAFTKNALPIATRDQVKEGPATILTVVDGQKVESFNIEIMHLDPQPKPETKGMVIRITDPRLLSKTGGIIQGMSGSPIIQNGKLVGAVTHVLVNDPTAGYGCYIEWMLRDAGVKVRANAA